MSDDEVSDEVLIMVAHVRDRAAHMPSAAEIAGMALDAPEGDMTPAQIRALATQAIGQAEKVAFLLGRLASILDQKNE